MNSIVLSDGLAYEYLVKPNVRAKRLILRVDINGLIAITVPKNGAKNRDVEALIRQEERWIFDKLKNKIEKIIFKDQGIFTLFDEIYTINHTNISGGLTKFDEKSKILTVNCNPEFLHSRVCKWIKKHIHGYLKEMIALYSKNFERKCTSIKVKNTKTRWGSCSSKGTISLCWLLAFAPKYVCEYVVAHECTHLKHLNHGPAFWQTLNEIFPQTPEAERWLKFKGKTLFAYF